MAELEAAVTPGATGGLQSKVDALAAAARLRAGTPGAPAPADMEPMIDPSSLGAAFDMLSSYAEAMGKMQEVLRRDARDVGVLEGAAAHCLRWAWLHGLASTDNPWDSVVRLKVELQVKPQCSPTR